MLCFVQLVHAVLKIPKIKVNGNRVIVWFQVLRRSLERTQRSRLLACLHVIPC
jgi:hypothetical protein